LVIPNKCKPKGRNSMIQGFKERFQSSRVTRKELAEAAGIKESTLKQYIFGDRVSQHVLDTFEKLDNPQETLSTPPISPQEEEVVTKSSGEKKEDKSVMISSTEVMDAQVCQVMPNKNFRKVRILKTGEVVVARLTPRRRGEYMNRGKRLRVKLTDSTWWVQ